MLKLGRHVLVVWFSCDIMFTILHCYNTLVIDARWREGNYHRLNHVIVTSVYLQHYLYMYEIVIC